jgi:hypothetical protein
MKGKRRRNRHMTRRIRNARPSGWGEDSQYEPEPEPKPITRSRSTPGFGRDTPGRAGSWSINPFRPPGGYGYLR